MAVTEADIDRFCDKVFSRSRQLIGTGAWSGLDRGRLETWISALRDHDASLLAAALLDNLIYRSKAQFLAMMESTLLGIRLPGLPDSHDLAFVDSLNSRADPFVRFSPVIAEDQPPTKSGPYALRLLQRQFRVHDNWLIWPSQIAKVPNQVRYVFLLDDFTGTGEQFLGFWRKQGLDAIVSSRPELKLILLASAIHADGLKCIKDNIPNLTVLHAELLGPQHHFATGTSLEIYGEMKIKERVISSLEGVCQKCGIGSARVGTYGFGGLGLCYAFEHATPNNTLPIYWFESDQWAPFLSR